MVDPKGTDYSKYTGAYLLTPNMKEAFEAAKIKIENLNIKKRPISAVADNYEVRNAKIIIIEIDKKISFNLLFDKSNSLNKKNQIEKIRNEKN